MKVRFFLFGALFTMFVAAMVFLKSMSDMEEQLVLTQAELAKLQREKSARESAYAEARAEMRQLDEEHPFPDDPDKKMRVAMLDAIYRARAKDILGENHIDYDDDEEEDS